MTRMCNNRNINGGACNHTEGSFNSPLALTWPPIPSDPRREPPHLVMATEATHSDILQQLGVSYPQLIDYFSKAYTATLVGPAMACGSFT